MARINTNVPSMIAQFNLQRTNHELNNTLRALSTGLRINRGADDPAGLITSERLRSEIQGLDQAIQNSERASSVIATTEGYLAEVADLLNSIKSLVVEAANTGGLSQEEIDANQLQIDSALDSITRIANTASFAGLQLLNGSLEYQTSGVDVDDIVGVDVHGVQFGTQDNVSVEVEVINSAQTGQLFLSGVASAGNPAQGQLLSSVTVEVAGNLGVQTLTFVSGVTFSDVVDAVNTLRDSTGVSASLVDASDQTSGIVFNSIGYGSDEFVSVKKLGAGGDFFATYDAKGGNAVQRDEGRDVLATINGALAVGQGLNISLNSPALRLNLDLGTTFATTIGSSEEFRITGGGANFQLGPTVNATQQIGFGINSMAASRLGGTQLDGTRYFLDSLKSGQANSIQGGNAEEASRILENAILEVATARGRLGAFERNVLQTNARALQIGVENITASESLIRDADFAAETARLSRAQVLQQAGTSVLATANVSAQNVLQLLG